MYRTTFVIKHIQLTSAKLRDFYAGTRTPRSPLGFVKAKRTLNFGSFSLLAKHWRPVRRQPLYLTLLRRQRDSTGRVAEDAAHLAPRLSSCRVFTLWQTRSAASFHLHARTYLSTVHQRGNKISHIFRVSSINAWCSIYGPQPQTPSALVDTVDPAALHCALFIYCTAMLSLVSRTAGIQTTQTLV